MSMLFLFPILPMSLIELLKNKETWISFLDEKRSKNQLNKNEIDELEDFILNERYLSIDLNNLSYPRKIIISKIDSNKKRIVYAYKKEETMVLSLLAFLLKKYDYLLSDRCFSFRSDYTAKKAFDMIKNISDLDNKYVLKIDIHDYFNSIDVDILLEILREYIRDDDRLLDTIEYILKQDHCLYNNEIIEEKRGAMAGMPLANFFANIYLLSLDLNFSERNIDYFRYSDDIIMFFSDREELTKNYEILKDCIEEKHLSFNEDKVRIYNPHESFEFLGFSYSDGQIDLAKVAIDKLKKKINRKAKKIYRWRKRKKIDYERAARTMISNFDNKFYDLNGRGGFSWIRFYFPVLSTNKGLKIIDEYMLKYLRYLYSGRHYKGNYRIKYETLKELGYTPLLAEYYNWKKENRELLKQKNI